MYATTDWGPARPHPAPALPSRGPATTPGITGLVAVTLVLVLAAHLATGWPRLVLAVAACSWAAAALARSAWGTDEPAQ